MKKLISTGLVSVSALIFWSYISCQDEMQLIKVDQEPKDTLQNYKVIKDTVINSSAKESINILSYQPKQPLLILFKNNRISAANTNQHIVLFGAEDPGICDNNLNNVIILNNKISWTGTDLTDSNEGILVGHSINPTIIYNFFQNCPYGSPIKARGEICNRGGIGYNIYGNSFKVGTGAKGVKNVKFFNNTFYNSRTSIEGVIGSIYLNSNFEDPNLPSSSGCQIFNNIFYTKHQVPNIFCDTPSLEGLQCDYNVYWCEDGEPVFLIGGHTITYTQWQAMGYDTHSVLVNPKFVDTERLIPETALGYGKVLDDFWKKGLSTQNRWSGGEAILTDQGAKWQVGAFIIK